MTEEEIRDIIQEEINPIRSTGLFLWIAIIGFAVLSTIGSTLRFREVHNKIEQLENRETCPCQKMK